MKFHGINCFQLLAHWGGVFFIYMNKTKMGKHDKGKRNSFDVDYNEKEHGSGFKTQGQIKSNANETLVSKEEIISVLEQEIGVVKEILILIQSKKGD